MAVPVVEILAIGNEVLAGDVPDTNSHWLCRELVGRGARVTRITVLPDDPATIAANLDHHRSLRMGFPEVIFAQGKTAEQVTQIFQNLREHNQQVLATRVSAEMFQEIHSRLPGVTYHPVARMMYLDQDPARAKQSGIMVISAGTADIPVAEEAAITAELMGNQVERIFDVGVAGLHRLIDYLPVLQKARVLAVVAGMEGALPSVVGGLVTAPVIAVPTSIGYGASFHGLAALLAPGPTPIAALSASGTRRWDVRAG